MKLSLIALAVLLTLTLAACDGDEAPTEPTSPASMSSTVPEPTAVADSDLPTPTATPWVPPPPVTNRPGEPRIAPDALHPSVGLREDGVPLDARGTLVVYGKELRGPSNLEVVVFDLEQQERLSSFELEANLSFSVQLAGNRVIVSFGKQVWSYALDGSDARLLSNDLRVGNFRPSPDGKYLAVTGQGFGPTAVVEIVEVPTGDRLAHVDLLAEEPEWLGEPYPARWLSPTEVLIGALCHCDGMPEGFFDVVVDLDGTVTRSPENLPPARPAEVRLVDAFAVSCNLVGFAGGRTVQLVDAATEDVLASASNAAPIYTGAHEISPDGGEALIYYIEPDEELSSLLNTELAASRCVETGTGSGLDAARLGLGLLSSGGSHLQPVDTRLAVLERWYGDQLPVFVCGGERRPGADTREWLSSPALWRSPAGFGAPWGFAADECQDSRTAVLDMWIAGIEVDTDATAYRVLAFLDPTATAED